MDTCVSTSIVRRTSKTSGSSIESSSVLSSSVEEEDEDEDDREDDDDDVMELFLELVEEAVSDNDDEDEECNIRSTNVDSSSNSRLMDVRSCRCSSVVLHCRRDILRVVAGRFGCSCMHVGNYNYRNTLEFFPPKKMQIVQKCVYAGQF